MGGLKENNYSTRNRRDVWSITTKGFKGAHFATFPPELPELCIKAGTSEHGVCAECAAPWVRVVNVVRKGGRPKQGSFQKNENGVTRTTAGLDVPTDYKISRREMKGWQQTCSYDTTATVPATVLDIFGGSGTTAMVARKLGRHGIAIDISPEYLQIARERLGFQALDDWQNGRKAEANLEGLPLFEVAK